MALTTKTPGVYIEEIQRFPASVAAVPTSIPVFIGYTEKAVIDGVDWNFTNGPTNPIRIESLLQYQTIFGAANPETYTVTLTGENVSVAIASTTGTGKDFRLYYNLLMYFANGGGPCYIISVGLYSASTITGGAVLASGISRAEKEDEITLVVVPDAMSVEIDNEERSVIYNDMLAHCAKMADRFALMDVQVITSPTNTIANDAQDFRDNAVGANNLNYGAAYYPSFNPLFSFSYADAGVNILATDGLLPASVQAFSGKPLSAMLGINSFGTVTFTSGQTGLSGVLTIQLTALDFDLVITATTPNGAATQLAQVINTHATLSTIVKAVATTNTVKISALVPGVAGNYAFALSGTVSGVSITGSGNLSGFVDADVALYNRIKGLIDELPIQLYPSATMAGIYCSVDSTRGVWKAPANVGVNLMGNLGRTIKDSDQSDLNVDATSGKSIDVIRQFLGRGKIIWGARTLEGNSNEWRYINVRRTFIFIEESCKKATEFSVFEPNDMNTWLRIKGMISSFLNTLWRDGALAGSKPEQAFFVKVGLGETMTSQDILEGRLIVQIGLAVVRPAEFIILQFEHKLQVS